VGAGFELAAEQAQPAPQLKPALGWERRHLAGLICSPDGTGIVYFILS
jgi:hypothetical protein